MGAIFLINNVNASDVEIVQIEKHPVKGEQFSVQFKISVEGNNEPYISFDPDGLEVIGKRNQGLSIQTSYINGRIQTKREMSIVYDFLANKAGDAWLKNISIDVGDKKLKHPNKRIKIFNFARKNREVFVQAELSKENLYIGEGVDVKYFLYYRVPVIGTEIKKFPKFNGFLKRDFLREKIEQRVNYGGQIYEKHLIYSVRLYPEKAGNLYIDPISLKIIYESRSSGFPFGSSPFFGGQRYSKSIVSEKIKLNVLPLPQKNFPENFTGLVGKHDFNLEINKSKFLVNEAIEVKLEARGPGALEKLELPVIYYHPELEEFNSTSDLNVGSKPPFKKVDFTYLGRSPLKIEEKILTLYYFDPDKKDYFGVDLKVPQVVIAGGGTIAKTSGNNYTAIMPQDNSSSSMSELNIVAPIFSENIFSFSRINLIKLSVYSLSILLVFLTVEGLLKGLVRFERNHNESDKIYQSIRKDGITYSKLYSLLLLLFRDKNIISLEEELAKSNISKDLSDYFLNLLIKLEKSKFSTDVIDKGKIKINKAKFKLLMKHINENN